MSYMSNLHIQIMHWLSNYPVKKNTTRDKVVRDMRKRFPVVNSDEKARGIYKQWEDTEVCILCGKPRDPDDGRGHEKCDEKWRAC
jgi:hypothetical protein